MTALVREELYTVQEVAARLKVHPETVLRWLRDGTLKGFRLTGGRAGWRISEADFDDFLTRRREAAEGEP